MFGDDLGLVFARWTGQVEEIQKTPESRSAKTIVNHTNGRKRTEGKEIIMPD